MHGDTLGIIVNYKTEHLLQHLLDSINEDGNEPDFLIVDNASTNASYDVLTKLKEKNITILASKENLGFTGGINFGIRYLLNNKLAYKHLFLINPDALCCKNLIGGLASILNAHPEAAGVSPEIVGLNGVPCYSGSKIDYNQGRVLMQSHEFAQTKQNYFEVDSFTGCAVLLDLSKVLEAGLFNEALFMYYDEADLAIRLKKLGYKFYHASGYSVKHDVSYTTRNISFVKTYYMTRNRFIVFNSSMTLFNKAYFLVHEFAFHLKNLRFKNSYYHLKGWYDYLTGKKGNAFN